MANPKEVAGRRAAEEARDGDVLGLGTGSTVHFTLVRLAERIREEGLSVRGVPTSLDTERKARELGIPLVGLEEIERIDLTIDGADEIDRELRMIKGGGGALLREKVVASISEREVIVVGRNKLVDRLGQSFLLPVEVVPFARPVVARALQRLGCEPALRLAGPGESYVTDNGCEILDCRFPGGIEDPEEVALEIAQIPGVVEHGLFLGLATAAVVAAEDGSVEILERP